jgi:hypothetical protein
MHASFRLQGLVSKPRDRSYQAGRSKHWVKIKNRKHPAMGGSRHAFFKAATMSDNESGKENLTPDIPNEIVGPERTLLQMFELYVEPEVKRRQFPHTVIKAQVVRSDAKKHGTIHSGINLWGKLGNVDREFVDMFNKLSRDREAARYTTDKDISGLSTPT